MPARPRHQPRENQPGAHRSDAREHPAPGWVQLAIAALVALNAELALRLLYEPGSHLLGQRQAEVHGWLSMAALLLVLASRGLRLVAYRRALGLAAFFFALVHVWFSYQHVLGADWENLLFFSQADQLAIWLGVLATLGLVPLVLTSTNAATRRLGKRWKALHRLGPVMTLLAALHTAWIGVHFGLEPVAWTSVVLLAVTLTLLLFRNRKVRRKP